jgi:lactate permease
VAIWGTQAFKNLVNPIFTWNYPVEGLHNLIQKVPPVVAKPAVEGAVFAFTFLSYTGTGILIAALIAGCAMRFSPMRLVRAYGETLWVVRYSLLTIMAMLAIGTLTRFSGLDATLGLTFATTGICIHSLAPCRAGVLSRRPARLRRMCSGACCRPPPNSSAMPVLGGSEFRGWRNGQMIDAQSIVVASTATNWFA